MASASKRSTRPVARQKRDLWASRHRSHQTQIERRRAGFGFRSNERSRPRRASARAKNDPHGACVFAGSAGDGEPPNRPGEHRAAAPDRRRPGHRRRGAGVCRRAISPAVSRTARRRSFPSPPARMAISPASSRSHLHLRGPSHVLSTGCTSSTDAIGYAAMLIRSGVVPTMLVGGADAPIAPGILGAFEKMRVISTRRWEDPAKSSRPFSADRDGFVLGEGAWMFVLEEREAALSRGAAILAEIAGYGSTCDAYHRVQIAPDCREPVRAMELALTGCGSRQGRRRLRQPSRHGHGTERPHGDARGEKLFQLACPKDSDELD